MGMESVPTPIFPSSADRSTFYSVTWDSKRIYSATNQIPYSRLWLQFREEETEKLRKKGGLPVVFLWGRRVYFLMFSCGFLRAVILCLWMTVASSAAALAFHHQQLNQIFSFKSILANTFVKFPNEGTQAYQPEPLIGYLSSQPLGHYSKFGNVAPTETSKVPSNI